MWRAGWRLNQQHRSEDQPVLATALTGGEILFTVPLALGAGGGRGTGNYSLAGFRATSRVYQPRNKTLTRPIYFALLFSRSQRRRVQCALNPLLCPRSRSSISRRIGITRWGINFIREAPAAARILGSGLSRSAARAVRPEPIPSKVLAISLMRLTTFVSPSVSSNSS